MVPNGFIVSAVPQLRILTTVVDPLEIFLHESANFEFLILFRNDGRNTTPRSEFEKLAYSPIAISSRRNPLFSRVRSFHTFK